MAGAVNQERYLREGGLQFSPAAIPWLNGTYLTRELQLIAYYIQLNAAYLGKYFLPGTYCGAMYDNTINAGVNGKWVEVMKE